MPQVKGGKVRGLAVTSAKRSPAIPELPTVNEALGLKGHELIAWFGASAGGHAAGRDREAHQAFNAAANDKALQERFASNLGFTVEPGPPEALARRTQIETAKWANYVKVAKIEPQ